MREVDEARVGKRRENAAERLGAEPVDVRAARGPVLEEPPVGGHLREERPVNRDERILPDADAKAEPLELRDDGARLGVARGIERELEAGGGVLPGAAVEGDRLAGDGPRPHLPGDAEDLVARAVVGPGEDDAERPARRRGRAAREPGVGGQERGSASARQEEHVQRLVFHGHGVGAVRPERMADGVGDRARRVDEHGPPARAPGERGVLVSPLRVDAQRVVDTRAQELAALVQGPPLLAEPVDRLPRGQLEREQPAARQPREGWQPVRPHEVPVAGRLLHHPPGTNQNERERVAPQGQREVVPAYRDRVARLGQLQGSRLGLRDEDRIGGQVLAPHAEAHAVLVTRDAQRPTRRGDLHEPGRPLPRCPRDGDRRERGPRRLEGLEPGEAIPVHHHSPLATAVARLLT